MPTVLLIGASSDIGINLAISFKEKNYHVVLGYNKHLPKLLAIDMMKCDITKENDIDNIIKYTKEKYGNIDILINLSAIYMDNYFLNKTKEEFMKVLEVNLVGIFLCNKIYSKYISNGLIINIGSTDGLDTYNEYNIDYAISKAGLISMSKIINDISNNRVICICPNWVNSLSTKSMSDSFLNSELKRIGQSRLIEVAELVSSIHKIIDNIDNSTVVYRIDIKDDKIWIEKS